MTGVPLLSRRMADAAGWEPVVTKGDGNCLIHAAEIGAQRLGIEPPEEGWRAAISKSMVDLIPLMEQAPCVMIWRADYAMCGNSCNGCAAAKKLYYQTEGRDPNSTYYCAIEDTTIPREQHEEPGHVAEYPAYFARDGAQIHAHTHRHTHRHIQTVPN